MKRLFIFLLVATIALATAVPNTHFHIQQSEESSEESSQDESYASFGSIGFAVSLCTCIRAPGSASFESSISDIECYCQESDAQVFQESSEESSQGESSEGSAGLTLYPRFNTTDQMLLGCTCLFKTNQQESSGESSEESSAGKLNETFLLPTYTGREVVPIDCVCKNLDNLQLNVNTNPLLERVFIPAISSASQLNYSGDVVLETDIISLSQVQDLTQLIPLKCNASAAKAPFFNGSIVGADVTSKSYFSKCQPKIGQGVENVTFNTAQGTLSFRTVSVSVLKWSLTIAGFDMTQLSGVAPDQPSVGVFGFNATWTNVQYQLVNASQPIQAPPYVFIGEDVLNTVPAIPAPGLQSLKQRLLKHLLSFSQEQK